MALWHLLAIYFGITADLRFPYDPHTKLPHLD